MEPEATLLTLAEVSIATVGFAGVVSVFRGSPAPEDATMRQWRLRFMVSSGTGAVALSLLPLPLLAEGLAPKTVWAWGSGLVALMNIGIAVWLLGEQRVRFGAALYRGSIANDTVMLGVLAVVTGLALWNLAFPARFSFYLCGALVWLGLAIHTFFRMILASSKDLPRD